MRRLVVSRLVLIVAASLLWGTGCVVVERRATDAPPSPGPGGGHQAPQAEPAALHPSSDRRLVGSLGWALLSADVPRAVIEVDQFGRARLSQGVIGALEQAMREHGRKDDVEVVVSEAPATGEVHSLEDLVTASAEHRDRSSGNGTVALHVLVLPGRFEAEGVPGVAFHATVVALFPEEIGRLLPPGARVDAFETAVALHELGHGFGLVNLTGVGEFNEDPDHPGHSRDESSVMYRAVETPSLGQLFGTGPPPTFTESDRREMDAIRAQRP